MSALTLPSGDYPLVRSRTHTRRNRAASGPSYQGLVIAGCAAGAVAALALAVYPFAVALDAPRVTQSLLVVAMAAGMIVAPLTAIVGIGTRIVTRATEQQHLAMYQRVEAVLVARLAAGLEQRVDRLEATPDNAVAERFATLAEAMVERVEANVATLAEPGERWSVLPDQVTDQDLGGGGGELVPMPNSRAFQLGREVERRRWQRANGDPES